MPICSLPRPGISSRGGEPNELRRRFFSGGEHSDIEDRDATFFAETLDVVEPSLAKRSERFALAER